MAAVRESGIAVVDITDPAAMQVLHTTPVNYYQDNIVYVEGGGDLVTDVIIEGHGFIKSLETDGTDLWIANESYGIHRVPLANVITAAPVLEADGTLQIDPSAEVYTLQYAGEHPWGAPADLQLHTDVDGNVRLYAAIGFLGLGIYDPVTLERVGYYNLYTDTSVSEDWFLAMDVTTEVVDPATHIDPFTGMPNYNQASFEIQDVWHGGLDAPKPWADFDRYGKYYYKANKLDVETYTSGSGERTTVYLAYGLGGLVAGEVSGHGNALFLMPTLSDTTGAVDVVQATGAGGLNFMDLGVLDPAETDMSTKFTVPAYFASTSETYAAPDGTPTSPLAVGHTQGVATSPQYLYMADGPHGMSVWQIADADENALDEPHVVANTVVDEYAVDNPDGTTIYPTPHAYNVILGGGYDYRPEPVAQYRLQAEPGLEDSDPEALYMTPQYFPADTLLVDGDGQWYTLDEPRLLFYVAYGEAGVAKLDWSEPANPVLMEHQQTVGEATGTAIAHGRVYVADGGGGLVIFRQ